ncbi:MAG: hypothetical protein A2557_02830 [Candidatus Lambdaproteobacteria bacterium RIFOXYD2_FULL_56_26]|uniref:Uncharacterized protein n=1 Tax=Candidatus Lambdaproteobacteria bacterium RIFOXYD2_FULL_56_26 TaxID=1817773 RepID=A0A1F6GXA7_9PROT|nr:MAG: hypothetical protein A2557_02830 [Candidatus Lambdaproteobacteria bacterium RIFOXYD2_FULL_56_26]
MIPLLAAYLTGAALAWTLGHLGLGYQAPRSTTLALAWPLVLVFVLLMAFGQIQPEFFRRLK